jgi:hypothetical protein
MKNPSAIHKCKSCGFSGSGNYCSRCGQSFNTKRIAIIEFVRELYRFFVHIDKGFFFTLKQLIVAPGHMQRSYIDGYPIHPAGAGLCFIYLSVVL